MGINKHLKCMIFTITVALTSYIAALTSYSSITIFAPAVSSVFSTHYVQHIVYGIIFCFFGISTPFCIFWVGLMLAYYNDED